MIKAEILDVLVLLYLTNELAQGQFLAEFYRFKFRIFLLLDQLS